MGEGERKRKCRATRRPSSVERSGRPLSKSTSIVVVVCPLRPCALYGMFGRTSGIWSESRPSQGVGSVIVWSSYVMCYIYAWPLPVRRFQVDADWDVLVDYWLVCIFRGCWTWFSWYFARLIHLYGVLLWHTETHVCIYSVSYTHLTLPTILLV